MMFVMRGNSGLRKSVKCGFPPDVVMHCGRREFIGIFIEAFTPTFHKTAEELEPEIAQVDGYGTGTAEQCGLAFSLKLEEALCRVESELLMPEAGKQALDDRLELRAYPCGPFYEVTGAEGSYRLRLGRQMLLYKRIVVVPVGTLVGGDTFPLMVCADQGGRIGHLDMMADKPVGYGVGVSSLAEANEAVGCDL